MGGSLLSGESLLSGGRYFRDLLARYFRGVVTIGTLRYNFYVVSTNTTEKSKADFKNREIIFPSNISKDTAFIVFDYFSFNFGAFRLFWGNPGIQDGAGSI